MADVTGLPCGLCNQRIETLFDGVFCSECENPYHHKCYNGPPRQAQAGSYTYCGSVIRFSTSQASGRLAVEDIDAIVARQLREGTEPATIQNNLIKRGIDPQTAAAVVKNVKQTRAKVNHRAGQRNLLIGLLLFIFGLVVALVSLNVAHDSGGGKYIIDWGALLVGALLFFRGLSQISEK